MFDIDKEKKTILFCIALIKRFRNIINRNFGTKLPVIFEARGDILILLYRVSLWFFCKTVYRLSRLDTPCKLRQDQREIN